MNSSIVSVLNNTTNLKVLEIAKFLVENRNSRVELTFLKKDGSTRKLQFVPDSEYNRTFGIKSCPVGRKIVSTKVDKDMITVQEIVDFGTVQPRTVNLRTVLSYRKVA